jgi:hypothetical protein
MNRNLLSILAVSLAVLLAACGGGGGSGTGSTTTPTPSDPFIPSTITVATTIPNYTGEELAAYNTLNNARTTCGFGGLNQNTLLDTAAQNHNFYMATNNVFGHGESAGLPGFTGANSFNRAIAAGYPAVTLSENIAAKFGVAVTKTGYGAIGMKGLLAAPYHLNGLMDVDREVGISVRSSGPLGSGADYIVSGFTPAVWLSISAGSTLTLPAQKQSSTKVLTYPCNGITGTAYQLDAETPNPVPSRNLAVEPIGQPIFVQVREGRTLVVTSVSVTGPTGPAVELLPTMTNLTDPNLRLTPNEAIIMPSRPLAPNTSYFVVINGTNNGLPFTESFSFSTGS